ncbi:glycoside hydrolase family 2 protein [Pararcticibacter amylolyticus]|uniref:glycoside hydrolase family 2 protein n=1 Tax=Pararcticibacter amylolyticus TaxID=2173175 RepID=UPI001EE4B161|nr:sugar-binding domain-containing protein [Pararcticibacter amylolyticus]
MKHALSAVLKETLSDSSYEISLNGKWLFKTDPANEGEKLEWFANKSVIFPDALTVPGNWDTKNEYANYTGKAWYKKTIVMPAKLKGKVVRLYFEGVNTDVKVWVNGQFVTANNLGYLEFEKDVSAFLTYGASNTVTVSADNSFKVGALWSWGGIRRPVKLLINDPVYIKQTRITPKVDLLNKTATIDFAVSVFNKESSSQNVNGSVLVYHQKKLIKTIPFAASLGAESLQTINVKTQLLAADVNLWNLDDPQLYDCKVVLLKNKAVIDERKDRFGLRHIELDNVKHQLRLNGEVIRPVGFNLVPDDRTNGNALPLWRVKEDIDLMKSLGAGLCRMSHVPFHKELLNYLDEKGILIIEEIPVWGPSDLVKKDNEVTNVWMKRMINDHFNHPSIFGWSVGNEIGYNAEAMDYVEGSIIYTRPLDTTRMHVMISHSAHREKDPLQFSDLGFINWYGMSGNYADSVHKLHPNSTLFFSEYGYDQLNEDLSADFPIKALMDDISQKPYLIGASLWTFNDYRSNYKGTKEFSQNRPWGIVDAYRQKKNAFYSYRNANKPFAEITLSNAALSTDHKQFTAELTLKPHGALDIPAYPLLNYRVVWKVLDDNGLMTAGDSRSLSKISPGDNDINISLNSRMRGNIPARATVSIVSPLNYTLYDTTVYFRKPSVAKIIAAYSTLNTSGKDFFVKVLYEKNSSASSYKIRYSIDNQPEVETPQSNLNYINITGLKQQQIVKLNLVSMNNAGETITDLKPVTVSGTIKKPFIQYTEPADGGFFIGFETLPADNKLIVQVTDKAGNYTNCKEIEANVKGLIHIEGLINGKRYYYRLKRDQENDNWSPEVPVVPDGGLKPSNPFIQGVILSNNNAIVCFMPVRKTEGYCLQYKLPAENKWHTEIINASQIEEYQFKVKGNPKTIQVKLAAINQYGQSVYTEYTIPK